MGNEPITNAKHEHFCQLVSNGESATQAYILAGYSENGAKQSAARLLTNADVCARIDYLRKQKEQQHSEAVSTVIQRVGITKEWVLNNLVSVVERCMQAEPVFDRKGEAVLVETPSGDLAPAYTFNAAGANKALELIGSEVGMFVKKVETGGPGDFEKLSDDEIERRIKETENALGITQSAIGTAVSTSRAATKAQSS
jgi:phage terminase small subunit